MTISRAVLDVLPIHRDRMIVMTEKFSVESEGVHWKTTEHAAAIVYARHSLLVGIEGGGCFELFDPDPEACALVCDGPVTLAPHSRHLFPETFLLPFTGDVRAAMGGVYAKYVKARDDRIASLAKIKERAKASVGND